MWLGSSKFFPSQIASICQIVYRVFILSKRSKSTIKSGREGNKRRDPSLNFTSWEVLGGLFWGPFSEPFLTLFSCFRLLLPVPILWRGRADSNVRTLSKLHLPQPNVDVLPPSLPVHKTRWQKLCRGETGRPMLPNHHVSRR